MGTRLHIWQSFFDFYFVFFAWNFFFVNFFIMTSCMLSYTCSFTNKHTHAFNSDIESHAFTCVIIFLLFQRPYHQHTDIPRLLLISFAGSNTLSHILSSLFFILLTYLPPLMIFFSTLFYNHKHHQLYVL